MRLCKKARRFLIALLALALCGLIFAAAINLIVIGSVKKEIGKTFADGCMIEVGYHYFDENGKLIHEH